MILEKTKRLKQAKEEAIAEIETFRGECEGRFKEKQLHVSTIRFVCQGKRGLPRVNFSCFAHMKVLFIIQK